MRSRNPGLTRVSCLWRPLEKCIRTPEEEKKNLTDSGFDGKLSFCKITNPGCDSLTGS